MSTITKTLLLEKLKIIYSHLKSLCMLLDEKRI